MSLDWRTDKEKVVLYTMEHDAVEKNNILKFVSKWMDLETS